tara:strand:+ start:231 stop:398 length:168 start_codon:yes stop_codon:yes gene_type:complete
MGGQVRRLLQAAVLIHAHCLTRRQAAEWVMTAGKLVEYAGQRIEVSGRAEVATIK